MIHNSFLLQIDKHFSQTIHSNKNVIEETFGHFFISYLYNDTKMREKMGQKISICWLHKCQLLFFHKNSLSSDYLIISLEGKER
ncbi:hypothetical protein PORCAN_1033 [Porphyromonas crevioricanis JCM 13913]|nr:hypothetical protein PORCAN_1033 [Porphyromonas crevioricanis JCM 13913]